MASTEGKSSLPSTSPALAMSNQLLTFNVTGCVGDENEFKLLRETYACATGYFDPTVPIEVPWRTAKPATVYEFGPYADVCAVIVDLAGMAYMTGIEEHGSVQFINREDQIVQTIQTGKGRGPAFLMVVMPPRFGYVLRENAKVRHMGCRIAVARTTRPRTPLIPCAGFSGDIL